MANPFKEAENKKKKAPGNKQDPVGKKEPEVKVEPEVVQETPEKKTAAVIEEKALDKTIEKPIQKVEKKAETTKAASNDIFASLQTVKPAGKTYAFYLSDENVGKLKKKADKLGISASKLLDHILSEVL